MPATTMSPLLGLAIWSGHHEVAVENAELDHRVAADAQHEEFTIAGEVDGYGQQLLDVLLGEHVGTCGHVAHEGHVTNWAGVPSSRRC
jgi:hypothetical protein